MGRNGIITTEEILAQIGNADLEIDAKQARSRKNARIAIAAHERGPASCGTDGGYTRHRRAKQPACDACKAAHTVATREAKEKRRLRRLSVPLTLAERDLLVRTAELEGIDVGEWATNVLLAAAHRSAQRRTA